VFFVKEEMLKYLRGERNVVRDEFILSRERGDKSDFILVQHPEIQEPIYSFWVSRQRRAKRTAGPKHTGGRKPYVMVMIQELTALIASGVPADVVGYLICLAPYIEWGTGKLLVGRKKRQMKAEDIAEVFKKSYRHTLRILDEMKKYGLLSCEEGGYFISRSLIKKGAAKNS
jgi:hypothetical protein